jgi:heat-inducible transcriptional repressor
VGSRYISRRHEGELGLSSATIRNILSDLEYFGYIDHPHTSAGRVPTDRGYRFYLDSLMKTEYLSPREQETIRQNLDGSQTLDDLLREASKLLGRISRQLGLVTSPHLSSGVFERLELVQIVSTRVMVIISIKSGLVRTIMMEVSSEIPRDRLEDLTRMLNERLSGLTLQEIRETFADRVKNLQTEDSGLVQLFIDSVDKLFLPPRPDTLHVAGTETIIEQPEFTNPRDFRGVIELISDEELIIHVLRKVEDASQRPQVTVGVENEESKLKNYSVIRATYTAGDITGTVGVIGPTRMHYDRMIPLVDYVARTISEFFSQTRLTS